MKRLLLVALLGGCQLATGLSDLHPTSKPSMMSNAVSSCETDEQCTDEEASHCLANHCVDDGLAERWLCEEAEPEEFTVRFNFRVVDFLSREPPANVVVKACRFNDIGCFAPVDEFVDDQQTGHSQITLPTGFAGFFEITSDALPTLLYVTKPIEHSKSDRDVPIVTADALQLLASITGYSFDPELGVVLLEAIGCGDTPSGDVQFKLRDARADEFYLVDQIPDSQAELTVYDPINNTANGGFLNVPLGANTFSAHWGVDGIELQKFNAQVRSKTITFIDMKF